GPVQIVEPSVMCTNARCERNGITTVRVEVRGLISATWRDGLGQIAESRIVAVRRRVTRGIRHTGYRLRRCIVSVPCDAVRVVVILDRIGPAIGFQEPLLKHGARAPGAVDLGSDAVVIIYGF